MAATAEKQVVVETLKETALLMELTGENPFKIRAYANGARAVELLEEDLSLLLTEKRLTSVKGIGAALAQNIEELLKTGTLTLLNELRDRIPAGLLEVLKIPGLGPKKAKILYDELAIVTLAELEYACKENRLVELKGFGLKSQENILKGIEFLKRFQGQYYYAQAFDLAEKMCEDLRQCPSLTQVGLAGSLRRGKEVVKDIDLVAASNSPKEIADFLVNHPLVRDVVAYGETKVSVRLEQGIGLDLRIVDESAFASTLHHFTGSKEHNTALRHVAKSRGYKLNEYGLYQGEERIAFPHEEALYKQLGLAYIPPELREDMGEIEAAQSRTLPSLVESKDLRGIFHVHTNFSDGSNTLEDMVKACIALGYEYMGVSDHSQSAFYAGGLKEDDIKRQQEEIARLRDTYQNFYLFSGVESDIKADGSLDYSDDILARFDFVIASIHANLQMPIEKATQRIVNALRHPMTTMLGHPTGRILLGREGYPLDWEAVFAAALENEVIMELNASPARLDMDWRILKKAAQRGLQVSINPDAHRVEELQDTRFGVMVARKAWVESRQVFNSLSGAKVDQYLKKRKRG